ncbi:hypothetical protein [Methylocaldum sp.]|uniref:hypothetical protein n=1 Tax=Methylocaldum sp. TaxID=1969727 RepID=UPI002D6A981F|nr:hypothetical protein [Methylocaldum sp.]HYE34556.1 hypothetical protein [Methylocaldum sp.]
MAIIQCCLNDTGKRLKPFVKDRKLKKEDKLASDYRLWTPVADASITEIPDTGFTLYIDIKRSSALPNDCGVGHANGIYPSELAKPFNHLATPARSKSRFK